MPDMTNRQKQMWIDLVTTFLGEECVAHIMAHPQEPQLGMQPGDVPLGDTLSEEERFLYSLLPVLANGQKLLVQSMSAVNLLWELWWVLVSYNHRVVGNLGIRKGWMLVQPKQRNMLDEFAEDMRDALGLGKVVKGRFEYKKNEEEKILPS